MILIGLLHPVVTLQVCLLVEDISTADYGVLASQYSQHREQYLPCKHEFVDQAVCLLRQIWNKANTAQFIPSFSSFLASATCLTTSSADTPLTGGRGTTVGP
jgi:hypothetical protein